MEYYQACCMISTQFCALRCLCVDQQSSGHFGGKGFIAQSRSIDRSQHVDMGVCPVDLYRVRLRFRHRSGACITREGL